MFAGFAYSKIIDEG